MRLVLVLVILAAFNCGGRAALIGGDGDPDNPGAGPPAGRPDASPPLRDAGVPPRLDASPPLRDARVPSVGCRDVTGSWAGIWQSSGGASGTWQTDLVESANGALTGSSIVTGTACGTTSSVTGKRDDCSISFGLSSFGACTVDFVGTIDDSEMFGTFTVADGISDRGQWSGSRR